MAYSMLMIAGPSVYKMAASQSNVHHVPVCTERRRETSLLDKRAFVARHCYREPGVVISEANLAQVFLVIEGMLVSPDICMPEVAPCTSTYSQYNLSHSSPSTPLKVAWQVACQSSPTSGGRHRSPPTFVFESFVHPLLHEPSLAESPR